METNIVISCGLRDIFLTHSSFGIGFDLKDRQWSKIETVFGNFQNPCLAHDSFNFTSELKIRWQIVWNETIFLPGWHHQKRHSFKAIALGNDVNIIIIFYRLPLTKVYLERRLSRSQSKVKVTGSPGDLDTLADVAQQFFGVSGWNKKWNVGHTYGCVAMATNIWFYFPLSWSQQTTIEAHFVWF